MNEKSARKRRKHCALAVVRRSQKFRPTADPLPGGAGRKNLISWRLSLHLPTNPVWWGLMHAISSYRGHRPTNTHTNREGRLQYTAPLLSAQCNNERKKTKLKPKHRGRECSAQFFSRPFIQRNRIKCPKFCKHIQHIHLHKSVFTLRAKLHSVL